jgi:hypothetical protein
MRRLTRTLLRGARALRGRGEDAALALACSAAPAA